jgi:CheY-like chemotaxis protein
MKAKELWRPRIPTEVEKRILIVHSDETFREELTASLVREGYCVKRVASPSDAIKSIASSRPPLLLLELSFPDGAAHAGGVAWDNFLVMSWAGRFHSGAAIPFVALSSNTDDRARNQALESGAMGFLTTAAPTHEVLGVVSRAFGLASVA